MQDTNQFKLLPKVEVSFQDDFAGNDREYTLTPRYILNELHKNGLDSKIGDKILLWEIDTDKDNTKYFLCNIGEVIEATVDATKDSINNNDFAKLNNNSIIIKINKDAYFNTALDSPLFQ